MQVKPQAVPLNAHAKVVSYGFENSWKGSLMDGLLFRQLLIINRECNTFDAVCIDSPDNISYYFQNMLTN